jgi:hypothetical protein
MSTKHTPGPWRVERFGAVMAQADGRRCQVALVTGDPAPVSEPDDAVATREANACLIAAAPEMLAALEALTDPEGHIWHGTSGACTGECKAVRVAIAQAKGREP